jgi:hypothetical protein
VWLAVASFLFSRTVHLARAALVAFLAIASVLLIFATNTWYRGESSVGWVVGWLGGWFVRWARFGFAFSFFRRFDHSRRRSRLV